MSARLLRGQQPPCHRRPCHHHHHHHDPQGSRRRLRPSQAARLRQGAYLDLPRMLSLMEGPERMANDEIDPPPRVLLQDGAGGRPPQ